MLPPYRIEESQKLHRLLCRCCHGAVNKEVADKDIADIHDHLQKYAATPGFLLEFAGKNGGYDSHARSHLMDTLFLPFSDGAQQCPPELQVWKAETLFRLFTNFIHDAIANDTISRQQYSDFLTQPSNTQVSLLQYAVMNGDTKLTHLVFDEVKAHLDKDRYADLLASVTRDGGFSLLQSAVRTGDTELARFVFNEVKTHLDKDRYADLLAQPTEKKFSLLHTAAMTGNSDLTSFVFDEVEQHVPNARYQEMLTGHTTNHWNLFHQALYDLKTVTPNPFIITRIVDGFYKAFGNHQAYDNPEAKAQIRQLCGEVNQHNYPAFRLTKRKWLQELMQLSTNDPVLPSR